MGEWIPVSERPPKKEGAYLVTTDYGVDILSWSNDLSKVDEYVFDAHAGWYGDNTEYGYGECEVVRAWTYLPEPYKDGEHDD